MVFKHTDEFKRKTSIKMKKFWETYEDNRVIKHDKQFKKGYTPWNKGLKGVQKCSEETRKKMSKSQMGHIGYTKGTKHTAEHKEKISKSLYKFWDNREDFRRHPKHDKQFKKGYTPWNKGLHGEEYLNHYTNGFSRDGAIISKEHREKLSRINKGKINFWRGKKRPESTRQKIREKRSLQVFPIKDTKIEVKIKDFISEMKIFNLPHFYLNNIKHAYQVDFYIPKFNLVIECDGDYWHNYPDGTEIDKIRTVEMQEAGLNVMRLWEHDIKNMTLDEFREKINCFSNNVNK